VKFSLRQILASAAGATLAAVVASLFGVKGTIIGVAIGSAAATFGTAFVSQSIEHGHKAVKQVAVRAPESTLLRRLGGTKVAGETASASSESSGVLEESASASASAVSDGRDAASEVVGSVAAETTQIAPVVPNPDDTTVVPIAASTVDPTIAMAAVPGPGDPPTEEMALPGGQGRSIPWKAIVGAAAAVFILSLGVVTGIELLAGHSLSDLLGNHNNAGTSVGGIVNPPAPAPTATTSTTSTVPTTSTTSSSSTTTSRTSTTTTTAAGGATTTTSTVPSSTTTTSGSPIGSTTTTLAG
jgi:hypothetical protein